MKFQVRDYKRPTNTIDDVEDSLYNDVAVALWKLHCAVCGDEESDDEYIEACYDPAAEPQVQIEFKTR